MSGEGRSPAFFLLADVRQGMQQLSMMFCIAACTVPLRSAGEKCMCKDPCSEQEKT
jgi:hypothetical protein